MIRVVTVPRVVSPHPMCLDVDASADQPVWMRDDLDPHAPPIEYASGRVSWSGRRTREERDAARDAEAISEASAARESALRAIRNEIDDLERRRRAMQQSVASCSDHASVGQSSTVPFSGPVSEQRPGSHYNPAAHGNIQVTETCRCGAQRHTLINGIHREHSGWTRHYDAIDSRLADLRQAVRS